MRNRERRAHRPDRDDEATEPVPEEQGEDASEDLDLAPSPFLLEEEQESEPATEEPEAQPADEDDWRDGGDPASDALDDAPQPELEATEPEPEPEPEPELDAAEFAPPPEPEPTVEAPAPQTPAEAPPRASVREVAAGIDVPLRTMQDRLEQVLAGQNQLPLDIEARHEVSARADSTPREQRLDLVQRLLDPTLNLREVAMLLDVCTTTVRRYTDRGVLRCFRTPGNQRRFQLSDVLDFMERQQRGEI